MQITLKQTESEVTRILFLIKIARKEAKESRYWLNLLESINPDYRSEIQDLSNEANELRKILSTVNNKSKS